MNILIDNKEIENFTNTNESINILSYKELEEVHDGIYLIKTHNNQTFLKEAKTTWKSKPVVEFNVLAEDKLYRNVQFVLDKRTSTCLNFKKLGIITRLNEKTTPGTRIVTETNADIYTSKLNQSLEASIKLAEKYLADTTNTQQQQIESFVVAESTKWVQQVVEDAIVEIASVKDRINEDVSIARNQILFDSDDTFNKLENDLVVAKEKALQDIQSHGKSTTVDVIDSLKQFGELVEQHIKSQAQIIEQSIHRSVISSIEDTVISHTRETLKEADTNELVVNLYEKFSKPVVKQIIDRLNSSTDAAQHKVDTIIQEAQSKAKTIDALAKEIEQLKYRIARVAESGGGTNAVQYANGGVMNGTLIINGDLNVDGNITGHIGLSSLNQEGATNGQAIIWSDALASWVPGDASIKRVYYVGDGASSSFTINHQLSTLDLMYQVYDNSTQEVVVPYIKNTDAQNTQVEFSFVPSPSAYRVIIMK
jgi:hypothetical protein